jgi:phage terminase large subunit GpA-like protein
MQSKDDPKDLQNLINSTFAEVFEPRPSRQADISAIYKFRDIVKYDRGVIPFAGKVFLVLVSDVQDKYCPWAVWAVGPKHHALVDHGNAATLDDVVDLSHRTYRRGEEEHRVRVVGLDTGHRTDEAYAACVEMKRISGLVVIPIKGDTGAATSQGEPIRVQPIGRYPDGTPLPRHETIQLRHLHPRYFHDIAWDVMEPLEQGKGQTIVEAWEKRRIRLMLHREIDKDFVAQISAEVLVEDEGGKTTIKRIRKNNHQFDNFRYSLAIRKLLKNDLDAKETPQEQKATEQPKPPRQQSHPVIVLENITL